MIIQPNIKYYSVKYEREKGGPIVVCAFGYNIPKQEAERLRDERQKESGNKYTFYIEENINTKYL